MRANLALRPEPTTASGAPLLSANHLSLLNGLHDRPDGYAPSSAELVRAGIPHARAFRVAPSQWTLAKALRTLHPAWVTRGRNSSCVTWRLTDRGRDIIERVVPAYIRRVGPYQGMASIRDGSKGRRQADAVHTRRLRASTTQEGRSDLAVAGSLLFSWCVAHPRLNSYDVRAQVHVRAAIETYLQHFVLNFHRAPVGRHAVAQTHSPCPLVVDFDELRGPLPTGREGLSVENLGRRVVFRASTGALATQLWRLCSEGADWMNGGLTCEPTTAWEVIKAILGGVP